MDVFLRVFSVEDLVFYSCAARYCIGQEPDGTETPLKKTAFRLAGPNFERPLFRAICFFAASKTPPTVYRAGNQQPQYQAERARCAGYGLVTKFNSKITNSLDSKIKLKLMRSGGISDEDALNHPLSFPFTLGVYIPNESEIYAV